MLGHLALAEWHRPIARGAIMSVVLMVLGTGFGYVIQIFISRTLGPQEYGTYSYVLGLMNIARTVVTVSFDLAALRFASVYHTAGDWPRFRGFLRASRSTVALFSIAGTLFCASAVLMLRDRLPPALIEPLLAGCVLLAPTSLLTLEGALLRALRLVYESLIPNVFVRPFILAAILYVGAYWLGLAPTASLMLYANVGGVVIALLLSFGLMQRMVPQAARHIPLAWRAREWSVFCVVNLGQNLVYLLLSQQADVVVVGSMLGTKEAGFYAAASQISTLILLGVSTVNQFAAPILAEFHNRRADNGLKRVLARVMLLNAGLSLPLIVAVIVFGLFLLNMFGSAFATAYPVIVILAAGCIVNALWGALWGDILTMTGLQNESVVIVIVVTTLNLVLTLLLTPRLGMVGAAYATTLAVLVRSVLVAVVVHRKFGFWPWTVLRHAMA